MNYTITSNGFPTVTISKMQMGDKLYAERNSCIACSPICSDRNNRGANENLLRRRLMATELQGESYEPEIMPTAVSQIWSNFKAATKQTIDRKRLGERSYVLYEALADNQKATFRSCFPGTIMAWNATPLVQGECYVERGSRNVKSIKNKNQMSRPHGILLAVKGSFLVADMKVLAKVYHTEDVKIINFSETKDSFQKFSGNGNVFLEAHGDLQEIPLYPDESVDVFPGYLLAFTEGVKLQMRPAGDKTLRNEENNDYVIRMTAGELGGYVYTHSVKPTDFYSQQ